MLLRGAKDRRPPPRMPGMQHAMIHAHRLEVKRMPKPTTRALVMETMPEGILRRAAIGGLKPRFRMMVAE